LSSCLQDAVPAGARVTHFKSRAKEAFAKKDYHAALYFFGRVCPEGLQENVATLAIFTAVLLFST
jgi:hypothetical protein